jgi:hypothetical protein
MPSAKKEYYQHSMIDSIKQHLMMTKYPDPWGETSICLHYADMSAVLLESLGSGSAADDTPEIDRAAADADEQPVAAVPSPEVTA